MADLIGRGPSRRGFMVSAVGAGAALGFPVPTILAATTAPVKLGVLNTFSGPQSYPGRAALAGMNLYFDRIGWKSAGRKIELIKEDDQFNPQVGLEKAKKFVESDKVAMIVGPQGSNVALAILNYVKQVNAFLVISGAGDDALTRHLNPYVFRTSISVWQLSKPMSDWIYGNLATELVITAADYAGGRDVAGEFKKLFVAKGGKVLKEIFPPLGTTDYSPYLTDLKSLAPKATYNFYPGSDALRFMQQYQQYGLSNRAPLTGFEMISQESIEAAGKATLGVITAVPYTNTLDNPENKRFVKEYTATTKQIPDLFAEYGFVAAQAIDETLKAVDGDTSNKDKLSKAMVKVSFDAPRGPFRFDPKTHNPIQNIYICKVQEIDGRIQNKNFSTAKDVRDPGE